MQEVVMRGLLLIFMALLATNALADTPFYVGGGYGWAKLKQDVDTNDNGDFDDNEGGFTLFAGFELNDRIAFEGGYIDFGDVDDSFTQEVPLTLLPCPPACTTVPRKIEFEADGWYVNAQYHFPVGNSGSFDVMGGFVFADSTTKVKPDQGDTGPTLRDDSTDKGLLFGLAYTYQLNPTLYLRGAGNYYKLDFDNVIDDPYRLSLDLIWDF
jgi:hypothetical protein